MWGTSSERGTLSKNCHFSWLLIVTLFFFLTSSVWSLHTQQTQIKTVLWLSRFSLYLPNPFDNRKSNHVLKTATNWNFANFSISVPFCCYCVFQSSFLSLFHLHTIAHHIPVLIAPHSLVMLLEDSCKFSLPPPPILLCRTSHHHASLKHQSNMSSN